MVDRQDHNIPLQGFSLPRIDIERLRNKLELPDQFLRTCTLREGTFVVVFILNTVCLMMISFLAMLLIEFPDATTAWWKERFRDDFDFYYMDENQDLINTLYPLWIPISYGIIGTKSLYFVTGLLVFYAIAKKTVHPCWYLPWLILTGILIGIMWLMAGTMIIVMFILLWFRPITVTWDIGPIACVIVYSVAWSYAWFVVIAHYQRRCIVKYWKERQVTMGTHTIGPAGY